MKEDSALLDRYLLGRTSPEETDAIELRFLEDPSLLESAEAAEFELLESYARGELDADDRAAVAARLQRSPELRETQAFTRALIDVARATPVVAKQSGLRTFLSNLFAPAARPASAAAALASIGAVWLGSQNVSLRQELAAAAGFERQVSVLRSENEQARGDLTAAQQESRESEAQFHATISRSQQRISELESQIASAPDRNLVTLSLTATTRSGGGAPRLVVPPGKTHARIELDLPARVGPAPWTATVEREGVAVWTETNLDVDRSSLGVIGTLEIPRQSLVAGRYEIVVRSATGPVATFPLTVERP